MLKFEHVFEEEPDYVGLSPELFETPVDAKIEFSVGDDGIWLSANSQGFLHLARIFAELGVRDFGEKGTHFHQPSWLKKPHGPTQEVSVELYNGDWNDNAQP